MKTVKNNYGISVKVMCASCQFKKNIDKMRTRECVRTKNVKIVTPKDCCEFWEMSEGLQNAGRLRVENSSLKGLEELEKLETVQETLINFIN